MADCTRLLKQRKGLHEHGSTCSTKLHENNSVNSACPSFHKGHMDGLRYMTLATHKMCPLYSGNLKYFIIDSKQICSFSGDRHYFFYNFFFFFFFLLCSHLLKDNLSQKQLMLFFAKCLEIQETMGNVLLIKAISTLETDPVPKVGKTIVVSWEGGPFLFVWLHSHFYLGGTS